MKARSIAEILERLAERPITLRRVCNALPHSKLRVRPASGLFAPIEDAWHLRDIEVEGWCHRISRLLNEEHPALDSIDGDRLATERQYIARELEPALEGFAAARAESLLLLRALAEEDYRRTAQFESRTITLRDLIGMMDEHDEAHLSCLQGVHVASRAA